MSKFISTGGSAAVAAAPAPYTASASAGGGLSVSGSYGVGESPVARWQRTARAVGVAASITRNFRTLRNQHDENLVREDQLEVRQTMYDKYVA